MAQRYRSHRALSGGTRGRVHESGLYQQLLCRQCAWLRLAADRLRHRICDGRAGTAAGHDALGLPGEKPAAGRRHIRLRPAHARRERRCVSGTPAAGIRRGPAALCPERKAGGQGHRLPVPGRVLRRGHTGAGHLRRDHRIKRGRQSEREHRTERGGPGPATRC